MKQRIDWQRLKTDFLHPLWLAGYILAGGIATYLLGILWADVLGMLRLGDFGPVPHIIAGGLRIGEGLRRFEGLPADHTVRLAQVTVLGSIIFSYIIAPSLFYWAIRARIRRRQEGPVTRFPWKIAVSFGVSGPTVLAIVLLSVVGPVLASSVFRSMQRAQTTQSNLDAIINDLNTLAMDALVYRVRPASMAGGDGRFVGYKIPPEFETNLNGRYKAAVAAEQVRFTGISILDTANTVVTTIDTDGKFLPGEWIYTGSFR